MAEKTNITTTAAGLAQHLRKLAEVCENHNTLVKGDPAFYRAVADTIEKEHAAAVETILKLTNALERAEGYAYYGGMVPDATRKEWLGLIKDALASVHYVVEASEKKEDK